MKKITFFTAFLMLMSFVSFGDNWTENFDSQTSNNYIASSYTISARDWTCSDAGNFVYGNSSMGSPAFTINDDKDSAFIALPVLNTCGTIAFKYAYKNGNSANVFLLQKSLDGISWENIDTTTLGDAANLSYVDYSFDVNDGSSSVYLRIMSDHQNAHLFIEDLSVTDYTGVYLTWSSLEFTESILNDGSISNTIDLTLEGDTFASVNDTISSLLTNNVPSGLSVLVLKTDSNHAVISLVGNAVNDSAIYNVFDMVISFLDTTFTNNDASNVMASTKSNLIVSFIDQAPPKILTWSDSVFVESNLNDGSISNTINVSLENETFFAADTITGYTTEHLPLGLSVLIVKTDDSNATISLTGQATSNMSADDISNLTITFLDTAFTGNSAMAVENYVDSTLAVQFMDVAPPKILTFSDSVFFESNLNDGSISNTINISLENEMFLAVDTITGYTTSNVPQGLSVLIVKTDSVNATISLIGQAVNNMLADNVSNLSINFLDTAFVGNSAIDVQNYSDTTLSISFMDEAPARVITWSDTVFTESLYNNGEISTIIELSLENETFTQTSGNLGFMAVNLPLGLELSVVATSDTTAQISILNSAVSHLNSDDIDSLEITFVDSIFTGGLASEVVNYSKTNLVIDFNDPEIMRNIVITEISYNPPESGIDSLEFVEIFNNDTIDINLAGYSFSGFNFVFDSVIIAPAEYIVVATNDTAMLNVFGINVYQWTNGGLSNGGETIKLLNISQEIVDEVSFSDNSPWPQEANGHGTSLVLCDPNSDNNDGSNWHASTTPQAAVAGLFASPGASDLVCEPFTDIEIISPEESNTACGLTDVEEVSYSILNTGNTVIDAGESVFTSFKLNMNTPIIEEYVLQADFNPADTLTITMDSTADLSALGMIGFTIISYNSTVGFADTLMGGVNNIDVSVEILNQSGSSLDTINTTSTSITIHTSDVFDQYVWETNVEVIGNERFLTTDVVGWVYLSVVNDNDCEAIDSIFIIRETSIENLSNMSLNIYPNPANSTVNVNFTSVEDVTINIITVTGQNIYTEMFKATSEINKSIDVSSFAKGIYYINLKSDSNNVVSKLIIE